MVDKINIETNRNFNIDEKKNIHFIGIGGIGMSAIAEILRSQGHNITGSDMNRNEIVERLKDRGINVHIGHDRNNVNDVDLVIYTAAISDENPELIRAKELGIPLISRAEALGRLMQQKKNSIAVSGTHGKTTTTSMLSLMLRDADYDPTLLIGGNLEELDGNVRIGKGDYFVTEACEYMDSFLYLEPKIEIVLNIDSDHLDYFRDIDHILESFQKFVGRVPPDGRVIAYSANPFVNKAVEGMENVITFGLNEDCDYYAVNIAFDGNGISKYELYRRGESLGTVSMNIPGEYNVLNSLAALACADTLGIDLKIAKSTLSNFQGTQRRFDIVGTTDKGVKIVDDYAHHPTEIKAALRAAKNIPSKSLWCVFQPHTYTRTIALFDEFASAFKDADKVIMVEIYAAREKNINKVSSKLLTDEIKREHPEKDVYYFETFEEVANFLFENTHEGDMVITMGAGDVYKIGEMVLEKR